MRKQARSLTSEPRVPYSVECDVVACSETCLGLHLQKADGCSIPVSAALLAALVALGNSAVAKEFRKTKVLIFVSDDVTFPFCSTFAHAHLVSRLSVFSFVGYLRMLAVQVSIGSGAGQKLPMRSRGCQDGSRSNCVVGVGTSLPASCCFAAGPWKTSCGFSFIHARAVSGMNRACGPRNSGLESFVYTVRLPAGFARMLAFRNASQPQILANVPWDAVLLLRQCWCASFQRKCPVPCSGSCEGWAR